MVLTLSMVYLKSIIPLLAAAIAVLLFVSFYTFYSSIRPSKFVSNNSPKDFSVEYEEVKLKTEDNVTLDAWFIPAANKTKTNSTVIVLHGYPFDKGNVLPVSLFLHEKFNLLLFDFRYLGKSEGSYTSVGFHEQKDLAAAVEYLRNKNQKKVGTFGFSLGAAVSIMAAESINLTAIVADSSYSSLNSMLQQAYKQFLFLKFPFIAATKIFSKLILDISIDKVSPAESIAELKTPVLLIHGSKDDQILVGNAYELKQAQPNAELWIVEGANHGEAYSLAKEDYERKVLEFFTKHLAIT